MLVLVSGCVWQAKQEHTWECNIDEDCDIKCEEYRLNINENIAYCTCKFFQVSFESFCIPHFNNSRYQVKITSNIQNSNVTNCTISANINGTKYTKEWLKVLKWINH